jgi:hypothetical protein
MRRFATTALIASGLAMRGISMQGLGREGRWDECRLLREANVEACLRRDGPNAPSTLAAQNYLAHALWRTGRPDEACELLRHVVRLGEKVLPAKHKLLKNSRGSLAKMEEFKP